MTSGRFDPASDRFVRISRSANVNIESVRELHPMFHGEYIVTLRNCTHVTLTRNYPITAGGAAAANYTIQYVNGTLRVISAPQLAIAGVSVDGTAQYVVSWQTITNQMYQLEYTADLNPPENWTPLGTPFAGTDGIVAVTNAMNVMPNCFFRVEVQ